MTRTLSVLMLTVAPPYFLAVLMMRTFNDLGPADTTRTLIVLLLTVTPRYFVAAPRTRTLNVRLCPEAVFGPADTTRTLSVLITVAPRYFLTVPMMRTLNELIYPNALFGVVGRTRTCNEFSAMCTPPSLDDSRWLLTRCPPDGPIHRRLPIYVHSTHRR